MAAGVQHHDGAGRCGVQVGQHAVEVDRAGGGIVITVAAHFKASIGEDGAVVFPAGVGDQHLGIGAELFQEVGADLQAAGAAHGLHGGNAAGFDDVGISAEHQALDSAVISGDTVNGQVATRRGLVHHGFFGGLHALQQRQLAVVVEIHAHAQVHLARVGVSCELFVQTQDRVAGGHFDGRKKRHEES
ncbi:hypothetical protein D3C72_1681720 [compost metagenome]